MNQEYDVAVLGGGLAGLSLLYHLSKSGSLAGRRVLLVEVTGRKSEYDRTWSFWERKPGPFEHLVHHHWDTVTVHDRTRNLVCPLAPYAYKLIRSSDFYAYVNEAIDANPSITRLAGRATDIDRSNELVRFSAAGDRYEVNLAFSSIPLHLRPRQINQPYLDQHFRGWVIETESDTFDPRQAALMDFRTPQKNETRFFYVLPVSKRKALVEIAIFSNDHLNIQEYDEIIEEYIGNHWTRGNYDIVHQEDGVIPMTTYPFPRREGNLIYIGLRGGAARPSTGYTFYGLQRQLAALAQLPLGEMRGPWRTKDLLYDATILRILQDRRLPGDKVFTDLFAANPPARLLAFLNGESSLMEEFSLMSTTDIATFGKAFVQEALAQK